VIVVVSNLLLVLINWIHIVGVVVWGGGAIFLTFILTPNLSRLPPKDAGALSMEVSKQFTKIGWLSIIVIGLTGLLRMFFTTRRSATPSKTNSATIKINNLSGHHWDLAGCCVETWWVLTSLKFFFKDLKNEAHENYLFCYNNNNYK
jgi:uncharacterized membrane protein